VPVRASTSDTPLCVLKDLCREHGIYSIASLAAFMEIKPGLTQRDIATLTGQSNSSINQWVNHFEVWGLISCTYREVGIRRLLVDMQWSAAGQDLAARIRSLLQP
jgi:DNA-binding IclR family transcriptional regulator